MTAKSNSRFWIPLIIVLILTTIIVYLFATAPEKLPESDGASTGVKIQVNQYFSLLQLENDVMRTLWTKEIVTNGKKFGELKFGEDWKVNGVEEGPLPALFLRESAEQIEKLPIALGLFLGSDFPIRSANKFDKTQNKIFQTIKKRNAPQFFYSEDIKRYTGMFPDVAHVKGCVNCHNEHEESPKKDWVIGDIMGATTWLYPKETLPLDEVISSISALRQTFLNTYLRYLEKSKQFKSPPVIGSKWPKSGRFLPTEEVFMEKFKNIVSKKSLNIILSLPDQKKGEAKL